MPGRQRRSAPGRLFPLCGFPRRPRRSDIPAATSIRFGSQSLILLYALSVEERFGGNALAAFDLNFEQFEDGAFGAIGEQTLLLRAQTAGSVAGGLHRTGFPNMQNLAAKIAVNARPREKSPAPVKNGTSGLMAPIDEAVLFLENRRQRGFGVVLWFGLNRSRFQTRERFHQEIRAGHCHSLP